jgi:hypothetical protein
MENCRRSEPGAVAAAGMSVVASSFPYASHPGVGLPPTPFLWSSRLSREQRVGDPARAPRHRTRSAAKELAVVLDLCHKAHHSLLSLDGVDEPWLCHRLLPCLGSLSLTSSISSLTAPTPSSAFFLFFTLPPSSASNHSCQVRRRPLPGWTRPAAHPFITSVGSVAAAAFLAGFTVAATFPARSAVPLTGSRLPGWIRRCRGLPGQIRCYPFYSVAGVATMTGADACAAVGLPGRAPRRPDGRRSKKVGLLVLFCCRPRQSLTLERQPLLKNRLLLRVSRLTRYLGAIAFSESTPVSTPAATFAPSWRCDCEGFQPVNSYLRRLLQSHRVRCPRCDCGGMLDCVCE